MSCRQTLSYLITNMGLCIVDKHPLISQRLSPSLSFSFAPLGFSLLYSNNCQNYQHYHHHPNSTSHSRTMTSTLAPIALQPQLPSHFVNLNHHHLNLLSTSTTIFHSLSRFNISSRNPIGDQEPHITAKHLSFWVLQTLTNGGDNLHVCGHLGIWLNRPLILEV